MWSNEINLIHVSHIIVVWFVLFAGIYFESSFSVKYIYDKAESSSNFNHYSIFWFSYGHVYYPKFIVYIDASAKNSLYKLYRIIIFIYYPSSMFYKLINQYIKYSILHYTRNACMWLIFMYYSTHTTCVPR